MSTRSPYALDFPAATRVAVVGAGYIAEYHLEILRRAPGVEVVAICDMDAERAQAVAERHGVPHCVGALSELRDVGVQVAHVLVPPSAHAAVTRELLELGIGAFVEKPLALDSAEGEELGALADAARLPLGVNANSLYHPSFAQLQERVRSGELGRVEHVRVTLAIPLRQLDAGQFGHWMFREPQNIVFESGPHPFAQVAALIGEPKRCQSRLLSTRELLPGQEFHDAWLVSVQGDEASAELYFSFGGSYPRSTIEVLCSDGGAQADLHHGLYEEERKTPWLDFWNGYRAGSVRGAGLRRSARANLRDYLAATLGIRERRDPFYAGMKGAIEAYHGALRAGKPIPVGAAEGTRVLRWCEAAAKPALQRAKRQEASAPAPLGALPIGGEPREGEVCVLGGTGFVGGVLVEELLERELPVTCVVRRTHALPAAVAEGARDGRVRLVGASLEQPERLREALAGAHTVLHLATGNGDTWEDIERSMIGGSVAAAEAALDAGAERFVFVSSIAALYLGPDAPAKEIGDDYELDPRPEERPLYARGKHATELALRALQRERGLPLVIARPGVVVGPGTPIQHSGIGLWVRDNHCVGWGEGRNALPLVDVRDVADALARLAAHRGFDLTGKALNLCARVPLSAREIVEVFREASGRDLHFHARSASTSQAMEIGKWLVKRAGGRKAPFPSWRDLKSRGLHPPFRCENARQVLGWSPIEDKDEFIEKVLRPMVAGG